MGNLESGGRQSTSLRRADTAASIMNLQGEVLLMRFIRLFSRYRAVSRWSGLLAAIAVVLLTLAASAQMVGSEKGNKHHWLVRFFYVEGRRATLRQWSKCLHGGRWRRG